MPRRQPGESWRAALALFLHYFPQYTLKDLQEGALSLGEFRLLYAGMVDQVNPEATEPDEEKVARLVREAHSKAKAPKRSRW